MKLHRRRSDWWPWEFNGEGEAIGAITFEEHPDQHSAVLAEALAIYDENPKHNRERTVRTREQADVLRARITTATTERAS